MTYKGRFSFFTGGWKNFGRGGKILGGVQVICNMPFLMLWVGHEMANQSAPGGLSKILVGSNTCWTELRKFRGLTSLTPPPENPSSRTLCKSQWDLQSVLDELSQANYINSIAIALIYMASQTLYAVPNKHFCSSTLITACIFFLIQQSNKLNFSTVSAY